MKKYFKFLLLLGIILIFLTGCVSDLVVPGGLGTGTLKIYLTDAPGDYKEVNINISKIEGHIADNGEEGSWEVLKEWHNGLAVDLIKLEDVSMLLASLELEPNKYTQLRIFLNGEASLVLEGEDGPNGPTETVPLEIPSSANSGIKLNHPFKIVEGMITKLTIDFDAEKSVIKTGNGKYKMEPVISLSSETYSTVEVPGGVGLVSGSVSYYESGNLALVGIGGVNIELTGGAYIFANTTTTSTEELIGTFNLVDVPAGTYTLNVYAEGYDDYSESGVVVVNGENTVVDVVFLVEEPGVISGIVKEAGSELTFINGATVSVTLSGGSTYNFDSFTETDTEGNFSIEQLPVGFYTLTVSADGYDEYNDATPGGIAVTTGAINNIGEIELILSTPSL
ncbi:MAG TPA: DUF4382 domain-containing protein [Atribacterota bacterium]|nr:DUF4382 domain-containing protein [Atribacterota bacterium]